MTDQATAQTGTGDATAAADTAAAVDKTATTAGTIIDAGAADAGAAGTGADAGAQAGKAADTGAVDWRDKLAAGDDKFRKRLDRFTDETSFAKSFRELERKLSSGEYKRGLPEGATPEEIATWRKESGLPETPEGYVEKLALPNGLVLGEADKPIVADFAAAAHAGNIAPDQFNALVAKYYEIQDKQRAAIEDQDAQFRAAAEDELRQVWEGPNYRRNLAAVNNFMASWPEDLRNGILAARTPDGKKLGDMPGFIRQIANIAMDLNPAATLVPAGTSDQTKGVNDRIADLEKMMGDRSSDYWRGPKSESLQQEIRDLYEARDKIRARAA
jgi:hypothetical protein